MGIGHLISKLNPFQVNCNRRPAAHGQDTVTNQTNFLTDTRRGRLALHVTLDLLVSFDESGISIATPGSNTPLSASMDESLSLPEHARHFPKAITGALRFLTTSRGDLGLRMIRIRTTATEGQTEISLWTLPGPFPRRMAARTHSALGARISLRRVIFKGALEDERVENVEILLNRSPFRSDFEGDRLQLAPASPFPSDPIAALAAAQYLMTHEWLRQEDEVVELYPGVGWLTVKLANRVRSWTCIEPFGIAKNDLVENLRHNRRHATVRSGSVTRCLSEIPNITVAIIHSDRLHNKFDIFDTISSIPVDRLIVLSDHQEQLAALTRTTDKIGYILSGEIPFVRTSSSGRSIVGALLMPKSY